MLLSHRAQQDPLPLSLVSSQLNGPQSGQCQLPGSLNQDLLVFDLERYEALACSNSGPSACRQCSARQLGSGLAKECSARATWQRPLQKRPFASLLQPQPGSPANSNSQAKAPGGHSLQVAIPWHGGQECFCRPPPLSYTCHWCWGKHHLACVSHRQVLCTSPWKRTTKSVLNTWSVSLRQQGRTRHYSS